MVDSTMNFADPFTIGLHVLFAGAIIAAFARASCLIIVKAMGRRLSGTQVLELVLLSLVLAALAGTLSYVAVVLISRM